MSNGFEQGDISRWYAVYTHPKQENRASSNLIAWGVEVFNPQLQEARRNIYTGESINVIKNLFPRYLFARFKSSELMHKVSFTRGVNSVVNFGRKAIAIDDEIITIIKSQVGEDNFIRLNFNFKAGDKVMIKDGPFRNLMGIFDKKIKNTDRVRILFEAITYDAHLTVEEKSLEGRRFKLASAI
jgi:transcriptional antiterminator RfaH